MIKLSTNQDKGTLTKTQISKKFAELKQYGYLVYNFNAGKKSNRYNHGAVGFVDFVIIKSPKIFFIEVKIGTDTLSPEQRILGNELLTLELHYKKAMYFIATEKNIDEIINFITR